MPPERYLEVVLEPLSTLEEADALLAGVVLQLAIEGTERQEAGKRRLALWAPWLLLVDSPVENAAGCR